MTSADGARRAYLGIGSNLGDRVEHLQLAVDHLAAARGVTVVAVSPVYETAPVGGPEQPDYLNAVVAVDTTCSARELLELAHAIEAAADRVRTVRWGPRTLDVDVLLVADEHVDEPDLTVPHPRMAERAFVVVPLADLDPTWRDRIRADHAAVRPDGSNLADARVDRHPNRGWNEGARTSVVHEQSRSQSVVSDAVTPGAFALVGPGRAGTTIATVLAARGWTAAAVAGRAPTSPSTVRVAALPGRACGCGRRRRSRRRPRARRHPRRRHRRDRGRARRRPAPRSPRRAPLGCVHARRARQAARGAPRRRDRQPAPVAVAALGRGGRRPPAGVVVRGRGPTGGRAPRAHARLATVPRGSCAAGPLPRRRHHRVEPPRRAPRSGRARRRRRRRTTRRTPAARTGERRQRRGARRGRRADRARGARRRRHRGRSPRRDSGRRARHLPRDGGGSLAAQRPRRRRARAPSSREKDA